MKKLLLILLMLLPITASAYDAEIDGIYYLFSGDEAIVTFRDQSQDGCGYNGDVIIPSQVIYKGKTYSVTRIGIGAFHNGKITSVKMANSIKSIGSYAFYGCGMLTEAYLSNNLTTIEEEAFNSCGLTSITLPNSLTYIGYCCFESCSRLENINIPNSVQFIDFGAFSRCSKIKTDNDGYLGSMLLDVTDKEAETVVIKEGTKFVDLSAFENCTNLKKISIPTSVISVTSVNSSGYIPSCLEDLIEEFDNVKYIGPILIGVSDKSLSTYTIREGTRYIINSAFGSCDNMTTIELPNTISSIDTHSFDFSGILSINIPKSVKHISELAFVSASTLKKITVDSNNQNYYSPYNSNSIVDKRKNEMYVHQNAVIPANVTSILLEGERENLNIPSGVKTISAISSDTDIKNLHIPSSVREIGTEVVWSDDDCNIYFDDYESICGISKYYHLNAPSRHLFIANKEITDIVIPSGITSIASMSFWICIYVEHLSIPASVNHIGSYAFHKCPFKDIMCYANIPPEIYESTFGDVDKSIPLYVPASSIDAYKSAEGWKEFTNILPISVDVTDGDEYENTKEEGDQIINYTRTFANTNWQAIYVPFCMSYADWSKDFEVARINDAHQWDDDDDGIIDRTQLEVIKIKSGWTEPNTPYLIRAKSVGEKVITVKDATLYKTEENTFDVTSWNTKFSFTGTYKTISGTDMKANGYYAMSNGKLVQAASTSSDLKPFRWYLDVTDRDGNKKNVNEVKIYVFGDDEDFETSVDLTTCVEKKHDDIYDLSGREVSNANKGIYVKNGKKYVVK